ncbi:YdcF family protein [bacterium SCSIO 12741]|nr:YdcF family protein [bacterium SCSIO 12741]
MRLHGAFFLSIFILLQSCKTLNYDKIAVNRYQYAQTVKPFDVLVVPGTPYYQEGMTEIMLYRLLWAKHLYDRGFADYIIFSGNAVYTPYVEGCIMKEYALLLGIPADKIIVEPQAENSVDNLYYSNLLARKNELKDLLVATDAFQSLRYSRFERQTNIQYNMVPMQKDSINLDFRFQVAINDSVCFQPGWVDYKKRKPWYERFARSGGKFLPDEVVK